MTATTIARPAPAAQVDYHGLNARLNLFDDQGRIQFEADKQAVREYFLQHVNQNTVFFHSLEEKLDYLVENGYYDPTVLDAYAPAFIKTLFKQAYAHKFRFATFLGAFKYYTSYTLKTFDGSRYLERFEDRVVMTALVLADGNQEQASRLVDEIITGRFQPATPTFLNAGKVAAGEMVSCFPAGTPITLERGQIPIEDVQPGDRALTHTGQYQPVTATGRREESRLLVSLECYEWSEPLWCTGEHPVLALTRRNVPAVHAGDETTGWLKWVAARDIAENDLIALTPNAARQLDHPTTILPEGVELIDGYALARVGKVAHEVPGEPVTVYNLETEADHTYIASGFIVHNCYLLRTEDNLESIARSVNSSLQLSKRGGGVAVCLTNLREQGAPIKQIEGQSSGVVPVMKLLEDSFSYANQLGARQGAGAVYLHAHHPDIMAFLDTKRENADEKVRIKTLSMGVVIPDITFELAKRNEDMYLFSPYDIERVYGQPMTEISISEKYDELVAEPRIRKTKTSARRFFQTLAEIQFESGYPYILFEDTANRANPIAGRITHSNLCSEVVQVSTPSTYNDDLSYDQVGKDISCNLGSMNIAKAMDGGDLGGTVEAAVRALTVVSEKTSMDSVPSIRRGNEASRAIGLGQMNLHGFLGRERIHYGSPEALDFVSCYFAAIAFYAIRASNKLAIEHGQTFEGFADSTYADGSFFAKYTETDWLPETETIGRLFDEHCIVLPTREDWAELKASVVTHGLYNAYLQAIPPTGSISYINNSTSSIHPVAAKIEIRKEGKLGRVYYPAPYLTNENTEFFTDAYEVGPQKIIDTYAAAGQHVDQGLSLTLFFPDTATTRDINRAQIYAWRSGIKTLYYIRLRQLALEGTEADGCVSCQL